VKWAGHVARIKKDKMLVVKPEGKRPLGRWEDKIKMDIRDIQ
jgi:hypothetical protein